MRVLIDADGCPVVKIVVDICKKRNIDCIIVCDFAHEFNYPDVQVIKVDKGADSADIKLVNTVNPRDIVVTQDYGLAAICLAKKAYIINQNGKRYTDTNIDALLLSRHTAKKIRRGGGHLKGPAKRLPEDDEKFIREFVKLMDEVCDGKD